MPRGRLIYFFTLKDGDDEMKKIFLSCIICSLISVQIFAQYSQNERDSIDHANNLDHQLMMKELGIKELRPGPSGDPNAPNAANADESKVLPYTLPDPLTFNNGEKVTTPSQWIKRRKEIKEDFDNEIYGRVPQNVPSVKWEIVSQKDTIIGKYSAHVKNLIGHVDNSSDPVINVNIQLTLTTPANIKKPVPVMMEFGFNFSTFFKMNEKMIKLIDSLSSWQPQVLSKGWGYAILVPTSFQADNGAGLREGIIGLVNKGQPRKLDDWGTLRAWAWGASRALDYFETDKDVDAKRVGIEGLSRYGKAAIVTMAYDKRFAIGFIGSSGAGGAKLLRRVFGEQVENLASSYEYHWFAPNFIKYAGPLTPNDLPVDAHELIAMCAPRPIFISCGSPKIEGNWIDGRGQFQAAVAAGPVYKLLGKKDLGTTKMPPMGTALIDGDIAFRQHFGGHTTIDNWPTFIIFAEKYFEK